MFIKSPHKMCCISALLQTQTFIAKPFETIESGKEKDKGS